jgi:hypothetical protein
VSALKWRTESGEVHFQDPGQACSSCSPLLQQVRHRLADAAQARICPGVAHTWPTQSCVLCGLGWRIPGVVQVVRLAPVVLGLPVETINVELVGPPPVDCIYCAVLRKYPLELARHRVQAHKEVS